MDNVCFIGMAGCGKSTIGRALSVELGVTFVDTDLLIEEKFQASLAQILQSKGYEFLRQAEEDVILALTNDTRIVSTGGSAVYSDKAMAHLSSISKILYIDTPLESIRQRIGEGEQRGLAAPGGLGIDEIYRERRPLYAKWAEVTLDGRNTVQEILAIAAGSIE